MSTEKENETLFLSIEQERGQNVRFSSPALVDKRERERAVRFPVDPLRARTKTTTTTQEFPRLMNFSTLFFFSFSRNSSRPMFHYIIVLPNLADGLKTRI